jgi:hippurate hydrolase
MEEKTGLAYASHDKAIWNGQDTFVAHSCGHDIHMASWVGTAKILLDLKDQWHGSLMFIAQPAEEALIADGVFTRFKKPDFGFGLHDGPFAYGTINYRVGVGSPILMAWRLRSMAEVDMARRRRKPSIP